jgi:hypothetical protein
LDNIAATADCARLISGIIVGAAIVLFFTFVFSSVVSTLLFGAALILSKKYVAREQPLNPRHSVGHAPSI